MQTATLRLAVVMSSRREDRGEAAFNLHVTSTCFFTTSSVRVIGHKLNRLRGMTSDWDHQSELLILRGTTGSTMSINKRPSTRNADGSMIELLHLIRVSNVVTVLIHLLTW